MQRSFIMNGGASKRYHTVDTQRTQDIAAHSFGVAWLCELLTGDKASKNLIMAALSHDLAEHMVGDIPSNAKREMGVGAMFHEIEMRKLEVVGLAKYINELTEGEQLTLKLADMVEGMCFCLRERKLGNRNVEIVFGRFKDYAGEVLDESQKNEAATSFCFHYNIAVELITNIVQEWKEITE